MTYLLVGNGGFILVGDPGSRLPIAIGPGDEPLVEVPLLNEDPDTDPPEELEDEAKNG
jgi:hypothetical protein